MMKARGLFITGTDTGIGKTHVSVRLLHVLQGFGLRVAGMKPVASGAKWQTGQWVNDDALALRAASSLPLAYQQVNPYVFEPPVAPHLAAEESESGLIWSGFIRPFWRWRMGWTVSSSRVWAAGECP